MKKIVLAILLIFGLLTSTLQVEADVSVKGYYRKDGTYVRPHMRSDPDGVFENNWSTKGNINPYTGEEGTKTSPSYNDSYDYNSSDSSGDDSGYESEYDDTSSDNYTVPTTPSTPSYDSDSSVEDDSVISKEESAAVEVINQYFSDLNNEYYEDAYKLWNSKWKKKHSYSKFKKGYKGVYQEVDNVYVSSFNSNKYTLKGELTTYENDGMHNYDFTYKVKLYSDDKGKILKGKLQKNY